MRVLQLILLLFVLTLARVGEASIISYSFQGTVFSASGTPFGLSIPAGTSVSGQFAYERNSTGIVLTPTVTKYLQHRTNGFLAQFGAHSFRADDYLITVTNNATSPSRDQVDISFRSTDMLLTSSPLYVNSTPLTTGTRLLIVSLRFPNNEFTSPSLPTNLIPANVTVTNGSSILSDSAIPRVFFTVQSITELPQATAVPEPGSGVLAVAGLAGTVALLRIKRRGGKR